MKTPTYRELDNYVRLTSGFSVKNCHQADIRARRGLTTRMAPNRIDRNMRKHPCPEGKELAINQALDALMSR